MSKTEQWSKGKEIYRERRDENLTPNKYGEDSELLRSILLGVESIVKRIALRKLGRRE